MTPENFKKARIALGLTAPQAATVLGYSHRARISEIENGKAPITDAVRRLMVAYISGYRPGDWPEGETENG